MKPDTLVIGDCHGHLDRLIALLEQEGLMSVDDGGRYTRLRPDVEIVQLGDLGHFGMDRGVVGPPKPKSPTADFLCYQLADEVIDVVLWGNHDRAVINAWHAFGGYVPPPERTKALMDTMRREGKLRLAAEAHGFLLTHAGLHKQFKHNRVPEEWKTDPAALAEALNDFDFYGDPDKPPEGAARELMATRDAISVYRGGPSTHGGILWRDAGEALHNGFRQVFGHTAKPKVRKYQASPKGYSYCVDTGTGTNGQLNGIWLPSEKIVGVKI